MLRWSFISSTYSTTRKTAMKTKQTIEINSAIYSMNWLMFWPFVCCKALIFSFSFFSGISKSGNIADLSLYVIMDYMRKHDELQKSAKFCQQLQNWQVTKHHPEVLLSCCLFDKIVRVADYSEVLPTSLTGRQERNWLTWHHQRIPQDHLICEEGGNQNNEHLKNKTSILKSSPSVPSAYLHASVSACILNKPN